MSMEVPVGDIPILASCNLRSNFIHGLHVDTTYLINPGGTHYIECSTTSYHLKIEVNGKLVQRTVTRGAHPDYNPAATMSHDSSRQLRCLIEGDSTVFTVTVSLEDEIGDLKKFIKKEREESILRNVDPNILVLWMVSPFHSRIQRCGSLPPTISKAQRTDGH